MTNLFESTVLDAAAIKDYQMCALLYDYRHREQRSEPVHGRELMAQRYETTLKKIISFFFYKKQAGLTPSYNALVNRWEKLWFPKDMTAYDLALEQHETWHGNLSSYSTAAAIALLKFHEDFADDDWEPLLISERFFVPLTAQIRLTGTFDLVVRQGRHHKVVMISGRQKRPSVTSLAMDFAILKHAFDTRHDYPVSARYGLYDAGSSRPGLVQAAPSGRDMEALHYWATQAVNVDAYIPRRGLTTHCRGCAFDAPCATWRGYPSSPA